MSEYRLEELFDLQMGKTPARNESSYWDSDDYKWISIGDLSKCGKYITETKEYITERAVTESGISRIPANTVVMSFKLSIGKTAITAEPMYSNEAIMSFRDRHFVDLLPDYIYYLLSGRNWDEGTNKAVMGKTLNKATLSKIKVNIHSSEQQREIVTILDKVSSVIDARQQELSALDDLIKARFVEMFGEPISNSKHLPIQKLGEICDLKAGDFTAADDIHDVQDDENPYPCYGGNGIRGYVDNYTHYGEFPIIGRQGALCGNVQYATGQFRNTEHAVLVTPKTALNRLWLFELLSLEDLYRFHTGAAQPGLAVKTLNVIDVPVADIQEQNSYAEFYAQINKSKDAIKKSLAETQTLFDSLMQKYFG